ncbi:MAG: hypothetical protein ABEK50_11460 [bacterium]
MTSNFYSERTARRAFFAATAFFLLSLIVLGGRFYSGDAEAYFTVAFKLSLGELPAISERLAGYGVRGTAGLLYAKFGIGLSLVLIPLIWITLIIALLAGGILSGPVLYASAHLIGPAIGGLGVYLFHTAQARLDFPERSRQAGTLFFLLGGLWLVYSRHLFAEPLVGVLLLSALHGILTEGSFGDWLLAGSTALLFLARAETLLIVGPVILVRLYKKRRLRPYVTFGVLAVGVFGWYNWLRFGRPFYTGMGHSKVETFSTPVLLGLYGQFFAAGNGLFVYAPFLGPTVLVSGLRLYKIGLYRDEYFLAWGAGCVMFLLLHSAWHSWMGGWSWGPRRMIPLLGFIHLAVGFSWQYLSGAFRRFLGVLLPISLAVNFAGLFGDFNQYYRGLFYSRDVLFDPANAQIVGHHLGLLSGQYAIENFWLNVLGLNYGIPVLVTLLLLSGLTLKKYLLLKTSHEP